MSNTQTFKGECSCGAVQVEVQGRPSAAGICHCHSCRKWHSAPVNTWAIWPDERVKVITGQDQLVEFTKPDSDGSSRRSLCKRCGGGVLNRKPKIGMTVVYAMTLTARAWCSSPPSTASMTKGSCTWPMGCRSSKTSPLPSAVPVTGAMSRRTPACGEDNAVSNQERRRNS